MPVESAADLAGMFGADEFAENAGYVAPVPGAVAVACTVIVDRGQGRGAQRGGGEIETAVSERMLWARKAELAEVRRDGLFRMRTAAGAETGEVFRVAALPKLDHGEALWSVELWIVE